MPADGESGGLKLEDIFIYWSVALQIEMKIYIIRLTYTTHHWFLTTGFIEHAGLWNQRLFMLRGRKHRTVATGFDTANSEVIQIYSNWPVSCDFVAMWLPW